MEKQLTKVTIGSKANIFHCPMAGVTIAKGEVKELNAKQMQFPKVRKAFDSGHLIVIKEEAKPTSVEELMQSFYALQEKNSELEGKDLVKALAKPFTLDNLKRMAEELSIEPEDGDTKNDLVEAILQELAESEEEEDIEEA